MMLDLLKRHTPTGDLIQEWVKAGWYRIVKYDLPPDAMPWYLVQVGWLGSVYGVPGSDRGAPGEYNYQLLCAANPIACIEQLADVAKHYLQPTKVKRRGRDKLPRTRIVDEIDINATIRALIRDGGTDIARQQALIRRPATTQPVGATT